MIWYPELLDVYLGLHRISGSQDEVSKRYTSKGVYLHPKYGVPTSYNNDIAILKLDAPGGVPDIYKPICLPRSDAWYPPELSLTVAGWGSTSSSKLIYQYQQTSKLCLMHRLCNTFWVCFYGGINIT